MKLESINELKDLINWEYKGGECLLNLENYRLDQLRPESLKEGADIIIDRKNYLNLCFRIFSKMPYESIITNKKLKLENQSEGIVYIDTKVSNIEEVFIKSYSAARASDFFMEHTPTLIIFSYNLGNVKENKTAWRIEDPVSNEECVNIFSKMLNFMKFIEIPLENFKAIYSKLDNDFNNLQKTFKRKFPFIIPAFMEVCKKELTKEEFLYILSSDI